MQHRSLVHSELLRTVDVIMQDLRAMKEAQDHSSSAALQDITEQQMRDAKKAARAAADVLMLTDAPLLFPPGQLALAAMRSGFNKVWRKGYWS